MTTLNLFTTAAQAFSGFLLIQNHGPLLADTNYYDSEAAQEGLLFLSFNAGAVRMLVPDAISHIVPELKTGKHVVVTRTTASDRKGVSILFEDHSDAPFVVFVCDEQVDRTIGNDLPDGYRFLVYTREGLVMDVLNRATLATPVRKSKTQRNGRK